MPEKLFQLTEYEFAFISFVHEALHELMAAQDPVLGSIKRVRSKQMATVQNSMPTGEVVEGNPLQMEVPFIFKSDDVIRGAVDEIGSVIDAASDEALKQVMPQFFQRMGQITEAAGNAYNAQGQPLSHDMVLDMFDRVEIGFDGLGNPIMPTLIAGTELYRNLQKLSPPTPEQHRRFAEIIERKRSEHNARRRHRKLP
jgi:hypothetical protein